MQLGESIDFSDKSMKIMQDAQIQLAIIFGFKPTLSQTLEHILNNVQKDLSNFQHSGPKPGPEYYRTQSGFFPSPNQPKW